MQAEKGNVPAMTEPSPTNPLIQICPCCGTMGNLFATNDKVVLCAYCRASFFKDTENAAVTPKEREKIEGIKKSLQGMTYSMNASDVIRFLVELVERLDAEEKTS